LVEWIVYLFNVIRLVAWRSGGWESKG